MSAFDGFPAFYAVTWLMECDGGRENEMPDFGEREIVCIFVETNLKILYENEI